MLHVIADDSCLELIVKVLSLVRLGAMLLRNTPNRDGERGSQCARVSAHRGTNEVAEN